MLMIVAVKKAILNLRLRPEVRDEFAVAAELRGASMSGLLHQFIVRTIREEKELSPQSFTKSERRANSYIPVAPKELRPVFTPHSVYRICSKRLRFIASFLRLQTWQTCQTQLRDRQGFTMSKPRQAER